uniref:Ribonuclease E n=1 Tax=Polysiphonia sp. TaxID=1967842 RepID=A0A1Z1MTH5_9FLOR|nr:ribonuclease E [Polysiphonia sp.]
MVKKIIISYLNGVAATLHKSKVQDIILINKTYQVNDIYIGVVKKIFSSINAAFIDLGSFGKSGFIHMSDVKNLDRGQRFFSISDLLSIDQLIIVQVIKEPTHLKGPRLTSNIHLHGKYLVLMPLCNTVLISNRIYDDNERIHLYSLAILIKPELMGLMIKSSAQGVSEALILYDLDLLIKQWLFVQKKALTASIPSLIYKDEDLVRRVIRDFYDKSVKKIVIDSEYGLKLIYYYLKKWFYLSTSISTKIQLYNRSCCILDKFLVMHTIKQLLEPRVDLLDGGYLFIENYEALTVIDVNSGSFNKMHSSKDSILKINCYAAVEIAYQIKVRNVNGIIIIDFIDMHSKRDQLKLLEHFNKILMHDDCIPQVVGLSQLGLLELTRRRSGQSLRELFCLPTVDRISDRSVVLTYDSYSKLYFYISHKDLKNQYFLNKHIHSLFFSKHFKSCKLLKSKLITLYTVLLYEYYYLIDSSNLIYFFYPRANYILPSLFYLQFARF